MDKGKPEQTLDIDYDIEGSDVGYRWFARTHATPLFPFGFGLSYTRFEHRPPTMKGGNAPMAGFTIANIGKRPGADLGQAYLVGTPEGETLRLVGFAKADLRPGERRALDVTIDPRLLANWKDGKWHMKKGNYCFALGGSATALDSPVEVMLDGHDW